jgi:8-oxo-dGTP pyrophosphatase MutT (NUDIX family)
VIPTKYRKRVEIFIVKKNMLVVGLKGTELHTPGGGIEENETIEEATKKEALEELGISVTNVELLTKETLIMDWYDLERRGYDLPPMVKERMKKYRGSESYFVSSIFSGIDRSIYGEAGDKLKPITVSYNRLLRRFENEAKIDNMYSDASKFRVKMLLELRKQGKIK